jgi:signal transduction histidine kinase
MADQSLQELGRGYVAGTASEAEFHRLLDKLPVAAYTCDAEGLITYFNPPAAKVWGREPKLRDPADRYCGSYKLFTSEGVPIQHNQCWMALALQKNREYNGYELVMERPDGTRVMVLAHANPIHDEDGKLIGAVNVLVDITGQKQAEEVLRDAERNKDEFLATLAHELRNPLTPIRNGLQILRMTGATGAAQERVLDTLDRQIQHIVRLVDDLLEISRISRGKLEIRKERVELVSIVETALETTRPLIDAAGHELTVSLPADPIVLEADPVRLAQVLSNLLNNAAKYTEHGGRIWLNAEKLDNEVLIRVRDTGIGIPGHILPRIFDIFRQTDASRSRQNGLGIGLTVVKGLIEMHGGKVQAYSAGVGRGSEFTVRLPLALSPTARTTPTQEQSAATSRALSKRRILIVDDNRDGAESLAMLLNFMGSDVRVALSGPAALEIMTSYKPNVVLLDIGMPGMDGYEVANQVRQHPQLKDVTLIALTGWSQEEDRRRCRKAGFDHHMIKPVDFDALQALLVSLPM